jgi:hypothetical protein
VLFLLLLILDIYRALYEDVFLIFDLEYGLMRHHVLEHGIHDLTVNDFDSLCLWCHPDEVRVVLHYVLDRSVLFDITAKDLQILVICRELRIVLIYLKWCIFIIHLFLS